MTMENQTFVLIDGNAILHRAYHAYPKTMQTISGELTNATYGFTATLLHAFKQLKPSHVVVVFDAKGKTFRHEKFEAYKASRPKMDDELVSQISRTKEVVSTLNIPQFELTGYEADDLIGTLSKMLKNQKQETDIKTIIVTGDRDALQLIDERTRVYFPSRGKIPAKMVDEAVFEADYGFKPQQLIDLKALAGDNSDEIPGVRGIGPKTATQLIQHYGSVENIYQHLDEISLPIRNKLEIDKDKAFLSKELATIKQDVPLEFELESSRLSNYDKEKVVELFLQLQFASLIKRLPDDSFEFSVQDIFTKEEVTSKKKVEISKDQMSLF